MSRDPSELPRKRLKVSQSRPQARQSVSSNDCNTHAPGLSSPRNASTHRNVSSLKERAQTLLGQRRKLPIWPHGEQIRSALRKKNILLLVGETGSGKSTQIPQFLLGESWCRPQTVQAPDGSRRQVGGRIAVTQPRRMAAISLARRVAEEMGTPLGSASPASRVGYAVRFDSSTSPSTRIKYVTEGMLLQEMLRDPGLCQYSAIIVDEVHERGTNVDLILGFLKRLLPDPSAERLGTPLKVVVMSATADVRRLRDFFDSGVSADSAIGNHDSSQREENESPDTRKRDPPRIAPSNSSESKVSVDNSTRRPGYAHAIIDAMALDSNVSSLQEAQVESTPLTSVCYIKGRQFPVKLIYSKQPVYDFVDAALQVIFAIHYKEPLPGDILVFLTGQETVESLEGLLNEYAQTLNAELPRMLVLPLFASLPQASQQRVFQPAPARTRKVIVATNIAETSVTVPGVRYVVDCGKSKIKQFRSRLGLDSLLVKPISKSSAIQRQGRAGREAAGQCFRLYTEADYDRLETIPVPEILRCDLAHAILNLKARGVDDVMGFPFLDPPPREALSKALLQLLQLAALGPTGEISSLGRQMARLPLSVPLARVLLAAAAPECDCLAEAIDVVACLSVENIFDVIMNEETKERAEEARRGLYRREGDHLTLLATVQAFTGENADRRAWADRHFVSYRALHSVMDVRKQLRMQALELFPGTFPSNPATPSRTATPELSQALLKAFLAGYAANTARLAPDGSYRILRTGAAVGANSGTTVAIHPSSTLFGRKVEAIMFAEYVFTTKSYARNVSAVEAAWIPEALEAAARSVEDQSK